MKRIAVIDGQGGGIGSFIIKRLRDELGESVEIIALGTNSAATTAMMKARANKGATGENAIIYNASKVDIIIGPLSIILSDGFLGEITTKITKAISSSTAKKLLLPLNQEGIEVIGTLKEPLPHLIEYLINRIKEVKDV
ncbi:MAG: DUF3842 family protein [Thermodesulfovibrionales bacterium]|nr:DUF3842 family protein [Thermodesulfovibrionales bacterium]